LPGIENGAVYEVRFSCLQAPAQFFKKLGWILEFCVLKADERLHGHGFHLDAQGVAERAVGVREAEEKIGMLVVGGAGDDAAVAEQDFDLEHAVVHQAVAMRGRLDADAGDRAAEGDGLQLRHHRRHHAVREAFRYQRLVGDHTFGRHMAFLDQENFIEVANVEPAARRAGAVAEQIRGVLRQPDRAAAFPKPRC